MAAPLQYCTFFVDGQCCGLDVARVQEIICAQPMTPVPLAPDVVCGLINLRGQIVTAIDLRRRLGMKERPAEQPPINVVVQTDDGACSLLVDEIGDVLEAPENAFERPPETLADPAKVMIRGAYKLKDCLLLILDADEVVRLDIAEG
jgi:purine-binding chemotaxis protein CheW